MPGAERLDDPALAADDRYRVSARGAYLMPTGRARPTASYSDSREAMREWQRYFDDKQMRERGPAIQRESARTQRANVLKVQVRHGARCDCHHMRWRACDQHDVVRVAS